MSLFVKLMIGGWTSAIAMWGFCALNASGQLIKVRRRMASWLDPSDRGVVRTSGQMLETEPRNAA
jgi:hypothetical protein